MGQAFDKDGRVLGPEIVGDNVSNVMDELIRKYTDAEEYRVRKLRESIPDESKLDLILHKLTSIESRLSALESARALSNFSVTTNAPPPPQRSESGEDRP